MTADRIRSEDELEHAPRVSRHPTPQPSPQEWDCGCITQVYVTARRDWPFEMRLAHLCPDGGCEVVRAAAVLAVDTRYGYTADYAPNPDAHRGEYELEQERITETLKQ
jgi:hypothetical protein